MDKLKLKKSQTERDVDAAEKYVPAEIGEGFDEIHLGTWTENETLDFYACDMNEDWN
tara:strand:- start:460 stop:630 length:171 start_codon:yes stop_codon:yes gene_type:complete